LRVIAIAVITTSLDCGLLGADAVSKAGAAAGIGREQAAEHADRRRLAAAVRRQWPAETQSGPAAF
jgi:hypothetical protein